MPDINQQLDSIINKLTLSTKGIVSGAKKGLFNLKDVFETKTGIDVRKPIYGERGAFGFPGKVGKVQSKFEEFYKTTGEQEKLIQAGLDVSPVGIAGRLQKVGTKAVQKQAPKLFEGFKDLTTKFLDYTKGKTTLSRQEIIDFARRPELKRGEADLLLRKLKEFEGNQTPVWHSTSKEAAQKIEQEGFKAQIGERSLGVTKGKGTFFWDEQGAAFDFEENFIRKGIEPARIEAKINGKIFDATSQDRSIRAIAEDTKFINQLKKDGYVAVRGTELDSPVTFVFEPSAVKTKSQLSKLPAQEFADSIRRDLLELKPVKVKEPQYARITINPYENSTTGRTIFEDKPLSGKNYEEVVFESPITTNGSSHYPNSKNYFAHARGDEVVEGGKKIWREQEIQSDLLQKETLSKMVEESVGDLKVKYEGGDIWSVIDEKGKVLQEFGGQNPTGGRYGANEARKLAERFVADNTKQAGQFEKLQPFTNDRFGERIMRERIKEKASKGYEKYRLPTGETVGRIEGFDLTRRWTFSREGTALETVTPQNIKKGAEIFDGNTEWYITNILEDGRFVATQKSTLRRVFPNISLNDIESFIKNCL